MILPEQALPKRILMTADPIGGVWTYALELAHGFQAHGIELILAVMGAALTPEQRQEANAVGRIQICESPFKLEWMPDPWSEVDLAGAWLLELEERFQPDLIHLNGYAHGALSWSAPTVVVGHSCVLSWWRAVRAEEAPPDWDRYRTAVARGLQSANLVVAPSQTMLSALRSYYGPLPASEMIYNGRELALGRLQKKEEFVLAAGRLWDEAKNLGALASFQAQFPWPIYVAGETECPAAKPPGADGIAAPLAPRSVASRCRTIRLLGRLTPAQLLPWYSRAAIYALPARYEPFGLSALEAGLAGCALVLGDIPSLREIWQDAALYVPSDDTRLLQQTIGELISDRDRLTEFGARSRRRATKFTRRQMVNAYLNAYCRVLRGATRSDCGAASEEETLCAL